MILLYYVFNFTYSKNVKASTAFIQRSLLKIFKNKTYHLKNLHSPLKNHLVAFKNQFIVIFVWSNVSLSYLLTLVFLITFITNTLREK